ncbi:hypothetical protein AYO21_00734 [Fonsecaea monophora]|uniref:BZIP domain-containing protein n=1 Tax=Fonsecaea monophora TaxID=254056 RepID=A0A177FKE5_9EURO|nr:hypothetical protein AYO21_00734 [Fonsecaea monophora]KAH0848486.1 hypothetical protein FOPE_02592 [Fonsecaea pedrosoi]OAG44774.1 hypothetical protein AYO21_00734 [Fonsecaea monophora]
MDDELKDISDAHERRKAQNRIAQRRRRQRLRQDAKPTPGDVTEMAGLEPSDLGMMGSENGAPSLNGAASSLWNQDVGGLDTDASFMDLNFLEPMEINELNEMLGVNDSPPLKIITDPSPSSSLSNRPGQVVSNHCRRCSSHLSKSTVASSPDNAFGGPHQAKATETAESAYDRRERCRGVQKPYVSRTSSGPQSLSLETTYFPPMDDVGTGNTTTYTESIQPSRHGSPIHTLNKRTWSDSRVQQQQQQPPRHTKVAPNPQRLSSTTSSTSSSSSLSHWSSTSSDVTELRPRDDWESQRSPLASTLTQRSQKLATDLIRLYELGVYLDIQSKDAELEELLSEVRRKFAVLHGKAEKRARNMNDDDATNRRYREIGFGEI